MLRVPTQASSRSSGSAVSFLGRHDATPRQSGAETPRVRQSPTPLRFEQLSARDVACDDGAGPIFVLRASEGFASLWRQVADARAPPQYTEVVRGADGRTYHTDAKLRSFFGKLGHALGNNLRSLGLPTPETWHHRAHPNVDEIREVTVEELLEDPSWLPTAPPRARARRRA